MTMFENLRRSLAPSGTLKIQCEACGHRTTWTHRQAVERCGLDATPMEIRRRVKCKACGVEGRARVWI